MSEVEAQGNGVLDAVEDAVKGFTEANFDKAFDLAVDALKGVIPNDQLDLVVGAVLNHFKPVLKKGLLALEDKIDGEVG